MVATLEDGVSVLRKAGEPLYQTVKYEPAPMPNRQSDGLGHYTLDDGNTWLNDSGGAYDAQQSYQQPQDEYFPWLRSLKYTVRSFPHEHRTRHIRTG